VIRPTAPSRDLAVALTRIDARAIEAKSVANNGLWVCGRETDDGSAEVYAPSLGPMRVIVPIANTSHACGRLIAALSPDAALALVAHLRALSAVEDAALSLAPGSGPSDAWVALAFTMHQAKKTQEALESALAKSVTSS
jgi:hypothetical protein